MKSKVYKLNQVPNYEDCVLAYGHFSTIHPGHIRYLRQAKAKGKNLVIALIGDNQKKYSFNQSERSEGLELLDIADGIVLLNGNELNEAIKIIKPIILILGNEFENEPSPEILKAIKELKSYGGNIQFHAGDTQYSGLDLLSYSEKELGMEKRKQFKEACLRQSLELNSLISSIKEWDETRLLVIGDTIIDQYSACEALGMSAEAPVVVVRELESKNFIGGAAIVASHIRALGAKCELISVVGNDDTSEIVRQKLLERDIGDSLIEDSSRPTTFKKRYVVGNQKLFRVSKLEDHNLDKDIELKVINRLKKLAPIVDGIIISDFVYGVITDKILHVIQDLSKKYNLLLFGDLQCSSQVGFITKFKNFSLICPNEREVRVALQDKESGLEELSRKILKNTKSEKLLLKLGPEGFIAYDTKSKGKSYNQPFPALSVNPLDVAGAGDSLLAVMATGLSSKQSMMTSAALGCCMASLAVETMGNTPITAKALTNHVNDLFK